MQHYYSILLVLFFQKPFDHRILFEIFVFVILPNQTCFTAMIAFSIVINFLNFFDCKYDTITYDKTKTNSTLSFLVQTCDKFRHLSHGTFIFKLVQGGPDVYHAFGRFD